MPIRRQLLRFLSVGVLNTLVGLTAIYCLRASGASEVAANAGGYAIALVASFITNKRWTFESEGNWGRHLLGFLSIVLFAYTLNLLTVLALLNWTHVDPRICQAAGIVPYTATVFVLSWWLFR